MLAHKQGRWQNLAKIMITGGNGVLGSALSQMFLKLGDEVSVIDIIRKDECWRLLEKGVMDDIDYTWKASQDIYPDELVEIDLVIDCAIGFPDRPFGSASPRAAINANLEPAVGLLESLRKLSNPPTVIYPSSFNSLYGNRGLYNEKTPVNPTSVYGWTKSAVEQLYRTYHYSFDMPIMITRVGSSFGEMMRTDELVAKLIISNLQNKKFSLKSPYSKRLWTYVGDVINSYEAIVKRSDYGHDPNFLDEIRSRNFVLNIAGNLGDQIISNVEVGGLIGEIMGADLSVKLENFYEPGEKIDGMPIDFTIDADWTRKLLKKYPENTLREGLEKTIAWFTSKLGKVGYWNAE